MTMAKNEFGRKIIMESVEPGGEPWLELTYEEALEVIKNSFPSPELRQMVPATALAIDYPAEGEQQLMDEDVVDGLMEDINGIEHLNSTGLVFTHGEDKVTEETLDVRLPDGSPEVTSSGAGRAACICTDDEVAQNSRLSQSPELPTFKQPSNSTPSRKSSGSSRNRSSVAAPSSDMRAAMQDEMHMEDSIATIAARDPILPDMPPFPGFGQVHKSTDETIPKSLVR
jgi:hypothetical protein